MKRLRLSLLFLVAVMAAGTGLRAQEVTRTLMPGWTWISCPTTDTMNLATAMGSFVPMQNDVITTQGGTAVYLNGQWRGNLSKFYPGYGYHYKSNRTEPVTVTFQTQSSSHGAVTTLEPTDITHTSAVVGGNVAINAGNHIFARGVCWGTEEMPTVDGIHTSGETVAGSQSIAIDGLTPSTTYYVRAYMVTDYGLAYGSQQSFTTLSGEHDYVDLGLPSGLLWATCNVGAYTPEDYGEYYAWGETQPKDTYNWSTYQYCNGSYSILTKYCNDSNFGYNGFTDNLTVLLPEDDAATANWGDDWRMPTKEEFQELYNNTTVTWTTQNGVNGRLFTASNGNSLFMPAAGCRGGSDLYYVGSFGYYWSSSLNTDYPNHAWYLYFDFNSGNYATTDDYRYLGHSVRAVRSTLQNPDYYIIDVTVNPVEGGYVGGIGIYREGASCTLTATANEGYTFANWTENGEVVSTDPVYFFTVNGHRNLLANFNCIIGGHAYVDLGLPSGLLWATCNVGADNPEDYGDYFAWGETQPKDTYSWSNYQHCNSGYSTLTKYCNNSSYGYNGYTDNLTTLLPEDDAATANWGGDWRMPTKEERQELYNNTTVTLTTQNGVYGMLFTASNGSNLFMPAAGCRDESSLYSEGSCGYYWLSSLDLNSPNSAWCYFFYSDNYEMCGFNRLYGSSVRPVRAGLQNNTPTGAIDGKFTINANGDQVYFSQGNLQYQASTDTWKFADNQYDFVGDANSNISSTYSGWIDLFGWGTSGYHDANDPYNVNYLPWSTSTSDVNMDYNDTGYGPSTNMASPNLLGSSANYDWGIYNSISNGGDVDNYWRTLTQSEWDYVFNIRTTASGIRYAKAEVNNINGVILLPDDWSTSTYSLRSTNTYNASFDINRLTASQWNTLEEAGAVFLPAAGERNDTSVYSVGSAGHYWSASYVNSYRSYYVGINDGFLYTTGYGPRYDGQSVRLVCNVQ